MDKVLLYFVIKYNGNWTKVYEALDKKERIEQDKLDSIEKEIDCNYITILNPLYPNSLKNCHKPPFVIFYKGDVSLLTNYRRILNLVVDDWSDNYSIEQYKKIQKGLSEDNKTYIVNCINKEPDKNEMNGNKTVAITNGNLNLKGYGLVISESLKLNVDQSEFYSRTCYSLANALIVFNVDRNSEKVKHINNAINDNKDIFVIPQPLTSYRFGNNNLIKQGAKLVEYPSDILNEI